MQNSDQDENGQPANSANCAAASSPVMSSPSVFNLFFLGILFVISVVLTPLCLWVLIFRLHLQAGGITIVLLLLAAAGIAGAFLTGRAIWSSVSSWKQARFANNSSASQGQHNVEKNKQVTLKQKQTMAVVFTALMAVNSAGSYEYMIRDLHRAHSVQIVGSVISMRQHPGLSKSSGMLPIPQLLTEVKYNFECKGDQFTKTEGLEHLSDFEAQQKYVPGRPLSVYVNTSDTNEASIQEPADPRPNEIITGFWVFAFLLGLAESLRLFLLIRKQERADLNPAN